MDSSSDSVSCHFIILHQWLFLALPMYTLTFSPLFPVTSVTFLLYYLIYVCIKTRHKTNRNILEEINKRSDICVLAFYPTTSQLLHHFAITGSVWGFKLFTLLSDQNRILKNPAASSIDLPRNSKCLTLI